MKIGPDFEITTDSFNWIVTHWVPGTDKDGNPKRHPRRSYHASLMQACQRVLEARAAVAAGTTVQEVIASLECAQAAICEAVKGVHK